METRTRTSKRIKADVDVSNIIGYSASDPAVPSPSFMAVTATVEDREMAGRIGDLEKASLSMLADVAELRNESAKLGSRIDGMRETNIRQAYINGECKTRVHEFEDRCLLRATMTNENFDKLNQRIEKQDREFRESIDDATNELRGQVNDLDQRIEKQEKANRQAMDEPKGHANDMNQKIKEQEEAIDVHQDAITTLIESDQKVKERIAKVENLAHTHTEPTEGFEEFNRLLKKELEGEFQKRTNELEKTLSVYQNAITTLIESDDKLKQRVANMEEATRNVPSIRSTDAVLERRIDDAEANLVHFSQMSQERELKVAAIEKRIGEDERTIGGLIEMSAQQAVRTASLEKTIGELLEKSRQADIRFSDIELVGANDLFADARANVVNGVAEKNRQMEIRVGCLEDMIASTAANSANAALIKEISDVSDTCVDLHREAAGTKQIIEEQHVQISLLNEQIGKLLTLYQELNNAMKLFVVRE